ncbi:MAG: hypothetical protein HQK51_02245 [Oligoflexia bacterium]|nr:hypothetical protein [Oligoflexia bacterium]
MNTSKIMIVVSFCVFVFLIIVPTISSSAVNKTADNIATNANTSVKLKNLKKEQQKSKLKSNEIEIIKEEKDSNESSLIFGKFTFKTLSLEPTLVVTDGNWKHGDDSEGEINSYGIEVRAFIQYTNFFGGITYGINSSKITPNTTQDRYFYYSDEKAKNQLIGLAGGIFLWQRLRLIGVYYVLNVLDVDNVSYEYIFSSDTPNVYKETHSSLRFVGNGFRVGAGFKITDLLIVEFSWMKQKYPKFSAQTIDYDTKNNTLPREFLHKIYMVSISCPFNFKIFDN